MVYSQSNLNVRPGLAIARSVGAIKGSEYSKIVIPIAVITGLTQYQGGYINFLYAFSIPDYQGSNTSKIVVKSYNIKLGWVMTSTSINFRKKEITEDYSDVSSGLTCTADIRVNGSNIELVLSGGFFSGITASVNGYGINLICTRPQIRFLTWSTPYGEN
jgi:hypothetical protein